MKTSQQQSILVALFCICFMHGLHDFMVSHFQKGYFDRQFSSVVSLVEASALSTSHTEPPQDVHVHWEWGDHINRGSVLEAVEWAESSHNPNVRDSGAGARGAMQIMPGTWAEVTKILFGEELPFDRAHDVDLNRQVGSHYLLMCQRWVKHYKGDPSNLTHILMAYNWGIGNAKRVGFDISKAPKETQDYVTKILHRIQTKE